MVERKIAGIVAAIEDGMYTPVLKERMKVLEARKAEIQGLLANARRPSVVRLHPNAAEIYRRKVADLELALNDDSIKAEAGDLLRSLIDRVVLTPAADAPDGIDAQLHGDLAAVLALSEPEQQKLPAVGAVGSQLSVVAVESRCGAVTVGRTYLFPPLSSGGASLVRPWLRFHTPLIEPDMRISQHPALGQDSRLRPRHVVPKPDQTDEPVVPVEV